ncbi:MAG: hypothetical protein GY903_01530 [Fuerstiella sp.]|nr:hypothetical protein [Fuerstiella sp.]MCP4853158.1 hypothetical protein [Fuerstiella sp.]
MRKSERTGRRARQRLWTAFTIAIILPASVAGAELRGCVARVDLTPPAELNAPLGGYGERLSAPARGVHDRILGKALVLNDRHFVHAGACSHGLLFSTHDGTIVPSSD